MICNLHQVDLALNYSDRIIGLSGGRIVLNKLTSDIDEYIFEISIETKIMGYFFEKK